MMFKLSQNYVEYLETFKKLGIMPFREEEKMRKSLGDYVNISVLRDILYSILLLSPEKYTPYLYSWGKFIGTQTARQATQELRLTFVSKLFASISPLKILSIDIYKDALMKGWTSIRT